MPVQTPVPAGIPKIDLHRHLEGSVRVATLAELGREHSLPLPTYDPVELRSYITLTQPAENLAGFLLPFRLIKFSFLSREVIERLTFEAIEDAALDGVDHLELRFSPEFMAFYYRLALEDVMDGITAGMELATRRFLTDVRLIVSISRDLSAETMGMPWPTPDEVVDLAIRYMDRGVVALDLAGVESGYPPSLFTRAFSRGRDAGLGVTVHAGEDDGPESIREAVEVLHATRIGHGVRVVSDPSVIGLVKDRGVCLELCPTSNVLTHAVESLESHPLRRLYDCGVSVTVNTDDPTVCGVTLTSEYELAMRAFGFGTDEMRKLAENAQRAAF